MGIQEIKSNANKIKDNVAGKARTAKSIATEKAKDAGIQVADIAKKQGSVLLAKAHEGVEATKESAKERKLKKLAPVMPAEYFADGYDLPYLIVIVDEDQRKHEVLCEGAIGWLGSQNGMEVLNMYYAFATSDCGLNFYPKPQIGAAYYVDTFDSKRYIDLDRIFHVVEQDQITELRNIAYCLGAKSCKLFSTCIEQTNKTKASRSNASAHLAIKSKESVGVSTEEAQEEYELSAHKILFEQQFEGTDTPVFPELRWFANDQEILSLINMRCGDNPNNIKNYKINIDSAKHSALKKDQAAKIDAVLKGVKLKADGKIEQRLNSEMQKSLLFEIEF